MKSIILMRHAKADPDSPSGRDFDRPLLDVGKAMAAETAARLVEAGVSIDCVLTSSALRTKQTAEIVSEVVCPNAPFFTVDELYLAVPDAYITALRQYSDEEYQSVLLVGHNPGIAQLMCSWANRILHVSPSTVAVFELHTDDWTSVRAAPRPNGKLSLYIHKGDVVPL